MSITGICGARAEKTDVHLFYAFERDTEWAHDGSIRVDEDAERDCAQKQQSEREALDLAAMEIYLEITAPGSCQYPARCNACV